MPQRQVSDSIASGAVARFGSVRCVPLCLLMLGYFSATALAQQSADPIETCSEITSPDARLACFDREAQRRRAAARDEGAGPVARGATTAAMPAAGTAGGAAAIKGPTGDGAVAHGQISAEREGEGRPPQVVKPLVAALARLKTRPGHQYYFELDNGEVWESTDSEPVLFLRPHETVRIRRGVLGAFFLKTEEGNSIRVHRLR